MAASFQHIETDVLVVGSGAAGMMAARAARDHGARVLIVDKSLLGRGGATVLAQMTVAVALGDAEPDDPTIHAADTVEGSRGMADPAIVAAIAERAPEVILEVERYGVHWARSHDGKHSQVVAPGHSRRRCVYVDVLNTGGALSAGLRKTIWRDPGIRHMSNVAITGIVVQDGVAVGAVGFRLQDLGPVSLGAAAVILATGGLTEIYARSSASANMTGDGYVLAVEAGARLRDMEMVQFFPIANLYPPLVGLDPIMWDPFRYKLGGRLLNGRHEEFMDSYAGEHAGQYITPRDTAAYAIFSEVRAGRGSPHGGAFLDFRMLAEDRLREAFGPVIDILARSGVDLTRDTVEVAPMAHFMLGGVEVDESMMTTVPGLWAVGELIAGMHGANRLSGNAITEALVSGRIAGEGAAHGGSGHPSAAAFDGPRRDEWERLQRFWHPREVAHDEVSIAALRKRLKRLMWEKAGPFRTEEQLAEALTELGQLEHSVTEAAMAREDSFPLSLLDKVDMRHMVLVSRAVLSSALLRRESRGAHVRLDYPGSEAPVSIIGCSTRGDGQWDVSMSSPLAEDVRR